MAAMGADSPQEAMGWNFLQCFGERTPGEEIQEGEGGCLCGPSAALCHSVLHNEPTIQPPCHRPDHDHYPPEQQTERRRCRAPFLARHCRVADTNCIAACSKRQHVPHALSAGQGSEQQYTLQGLVIALKILRRCDNAGLLCMQRTSSRRWSSIGTASTWRPATAAGASSCLTKYPRSR